MTSNGNPPPDPAPARHDAFAALRHANYRLFASAFALSSTGLQMMGMALGWEIFFRTHNPFHLGLVGLCRALPVILMALPAGYVIDSFDRRRVLAVTQLGFGLGCGLLAFFSHAAADLWVTYLIITLLGCIRSFNGPARSSLLPDLVPAPDFANAATWNSFVFQVSAIGGPLLAGWMIHRTETAWQVYAATSGLCIIAGASALNLRPLDHHAKPDPAAHAPRRLSLQGMLAGMSHVWREKTILAALTLDLFAVLLGGATALVPVYAEDILFVGPVGQGWLRAAPFIGATLTAVVLAVKPLRRRVGTKMLIAVAGFGLCTVVFGLSRWMWLSMAMLIILGALDGLSVVVRHVLVQMRTPRSLRGRVSAVNSVFIESSNEIGAFESGALARLIGAVPSVVLGGIGTILVVVGVGIWLPELRRLDNLDADKEPVAPPTEADPEPVEVPTPTQ